MTFATAELSWNRGDLNITSLTGYQWGDACRDQRCFLIAGGHSGSARRKRSRMYSPPSCALTTMEVTARSGGSLAFICSKMTSTDWSKISVHHLEAMALAGLRGAEHPHLPPEAGLRLSRSGSSVRLLSISATELRWLLVAVIPTNRKITTFHQPVFGRIGACVGPGQPVGGIRGVLRSLQLIAPCPRTRIRSPAPAVAQETRWVSASAPLHISEKLGRFLGQGVSELCLG